MLCQGILQLLTLHAYAFQTVLQGSYLVTNELILFLLGSELGPELIIDGCQPLLLGILFVDNSSQLVQGFLFLLDEL